MAIVQPISTDSLNTPSHSKLHRVLGIDNDAADKSVVIDASGELGIGTETPRARLTITSDPTNSNAPTAIIPAGTDTHTALFINGKGNANGEKYGIQFGNFEGYGFAGIFSVMSGTGGTTVGDLTFDTKNGTGDSALTERMRILSGGNVGIGTISPEKLLHIQGSNATQIIRANGSQPQTSSILFGAIATSADYLKGGIFYTNSASDGFGRGSIIFAQDSGANSDNATTADAVMTITNAGLVGIGITNPPVKLHLYDNSAAVEFGIHNSTRFWKLGARNLTSNGEFVIRDGTVGADRFVINYNGNVGIGTTTPSALLDVGGVNANIYSGTKLAVDTGITFFRASSSDTGTSPYFFARRARGTNASPAAVTNGDYVFNFIGDVYDGDSYEKVARFDFVVDGAVANGDTPGRILFSTTPSGSTTPVERLTIKSSGNVGIGNNAPTAVLHLKAGTASASTAPLKFSSGTNLTNPEAGVVEFDGTNFYITPSTVRYTILSTRELKTSLSDNSDSFVASQKAVKTAVDAKAPSADPTFTGTVVLPKTLEIQDTSADHQYVLAVNELTADRTITLPLLTGNDEFTFNAHTQTLTNKRITPRITTITSHATPTINTDNCDAVTITAQAEAITSMTTNLSGTPTNFQKLIIRIKDNGTARAITWGSSFEARGVALPTTTVISKVLTVGFIYDTVTSKWGCVASAQEA